MAQTRTQKLLHDISLTINSTLDLSTTLKQIVQIAMELVNADAGGVFLIAPEGEAFSFNYTINLPPSMAQSVLTSEETPLGWRMVETRTPLIINNYSTHPQALPALVAHGVRCIAGLPLITGQEVLGVLAMYHIQPRKHFTPHNMDLLQNVAQQASLAIINARRYQAEQQRTQELEALQPIFAEILSNNDLETLLELIVNRATNLLKAHKGAIALYDETNQRLSIVAGYNALSERDSLNSQAMEMDAIEKAASTRFPIITDNYQELKTKPQTGLTPVLTVAMPLISRNNLVGVLSVTYLDKQKKIGSDHIRVLTAFAQQATIAIQNANLFQMAIKETKRRTVLYQASQQIGRHLDLEQLCRSIHQAAAQLMPCEAFIISRFDDTHNDNEIEDIYIVDKGEKLLGQRRPLNSGVFGYAITRGHSIRIDDLNQVDPSAFVPVRYGNVNNSSLSAVVVLMQIGYKITGVMSAQSYQHAAYTDADLHTLELLASNASIAIENSKLYDDLVQDSKRRDLLYQASQEIGMWLEAEHLYVAIHKATEKLMPCEAFVISMLDHENNETDFVYLVDKDGRWPNTRRPLENSLSGYVISREESLLVEDLDEVEPIRHTSIAKGLYGEEPTRSMVVALMRRGGKITGALSAQSYQKHAYTEVDLKTLELIAANAAIAIENARLFAETRRLALTDDLTRIWNRRYFLDVARSEFAKLVQKEKEALAIILFDADHFKRVNDTYGHLVGDQVLQELAVRCQRSLRENDVMGRFGGEEFIVLLTNVDIQTAQQVGERIRENVGSTPLPTTGGNVPVTVSVGVAQCYNYDLIRLDTLIDRADKALYFAKRNGRNLTSVWDESLQHLGDTST